MAAVKWVWHGVTRGKVGDCAQVVGIVCVQRRNDQNLGLLFLPVYLESARTSLPCCRCLSFFCRIHSLDFRCSLDFLDFLVTGARSDTSTPACFPSSSLWERPMSMPPHFPFPVLWLFATYACGKAVLRPVRCAGATPSSTPTREGRQATSKLQTKTRRGHRIGTCKARPLRTLCDQHGLLGRLGVELERRPGRGLEHRVEGAEEAHQALAGHVRFLIAVAQPLQCADRDRSIKRAGAERQAFAHISLEHVAQRRLPLGRNVQHIATHIATDPHVALRVGDSRTKAAYVLLQDSAAEARATADVQHEAGFLRRQEQQLHGSVVAAGGKRGEGGGERGKGRARAAHEKRRGKKRAQET
eukprot:scaffold1315_cov359-Pinguiococcus_pyrenoidosus.AAC.5